MSWRELLERDEPELIHYPWTGERDVRVFGGRTWRVEGFLPQEHGWYSFAVKGRVAMVFGRAPHGAAPATKERQTGYLAGDRFVPDGASATDARAVEKAERVHLISDAECHRFSRVRVDRFYENGPLIFREPEFPLGPEQEVLDNFLDRSPSVAHVPGVTPALDIAFRIESWRRAETERRRAELERERAEAEARERALQLRQEIVERLGDGATRRELAKVDFDAAAAAALAVGGAEFLDARRGAQPLEKVVTFRLNGQRFACTCHAHTLQIIDSGICLKAEMDSDEWDAGTRGDPWFSLESLPSVIAAAEREGKLVVFRHV